ERSCAQSLPCSMTWRSPWTPARRRPPGPLPCPDLALLTAGTASPSIRTQRLSQGLGQGNGALAFRRDGHLRQGGAKGHLGRAIARLHQEGEGGRVQFLGADLDVD